MTSRSGSVRAWSGLTEGSRLNCRRVLLQAADGLEDQGTQNGRGGQSGTAHTLTIAALRLHAERMQLAAVERRVAGHFTTAHPHVPVAEVPAQPDDVHDLAGLGAVGDSFGTE